LRRREEGGKIPWGSSSGASTWEAWPSKQPRARRAEPVRRRGVLSGRRRGCGGSGRRGRCRRLSRPVVVIRGHHTISVPRSRVGVTTPIRHHRCTPMPLTDQEIEEEEAHFASVVAAFRKYSAHSVQLETIRWLPTDFARSPRTTGGGKISFVCRRKIKTSSKKSGTRPG
jgi:hypothetical protein